MIDVTLIVNGLDLHESLSTYKASIEISYHDVITTLDEVEHAYPGKNRDIVDFSLLPLTDRTASQLYDALSDLIIPVTFTSPHYISEVSKTMRVVSDLEATFGLRSGDGNRYYKGGTISLRAV